MTLPFWIKDLGDNVYEIKSPNAMMYGCPWYYKSTSDARRIIDQGNIILGVDGHFSQLAPKEYSFITEVLEWFSFTLHRKDGGIVLSAINLEELIKPVDA